MFLSNGFVHFHKLHQTGYIYCWIFQVSDCLLVFFSVGVDKIDWTVFVTVFEEKLSSFTPSYSGFRDKNIKKLSENSLYSIESLKDVPSKINFLYSEIQQILKDKVNIREKLNSIESYWTNNSLEKVDGLGSVYKLRVSFKLY